MRGGREEGRKEGSEGGSEGGRSIGGWIRERKSSCGGVTTTRFWPPVKVLCGHENKPTEDRKWDDC